MKARFAWYTDLGVRSEKLRLREHGSDELAHYSSACVDVEYEFPFGWSELEGIANRGCFDLTQHTRASGRDLSFFDEATKTRYVPHVVEPAAGVFRRSSRPVRRMTRLGSRALHARASGHLPRGSSARFGTTLSSVNDFLLLFDPALAFLFTGLNCVRASLPDRIDPSPGGHVSRCDEHTTVYVYFGNNFMNEETGDAILNQTDCS